MAGKANKVYLNGGGKEVTFQDGGSLVNLYIDVDDAEQKGAIRKSKKGTRFLSVTVAARREESEYGDTHYLYFNDFDNEKKGGDASRGKSVGSKTATTKKRRIDDDDDDSDNLPF